MYEYTRSSEIASSLTLTMFIHLVTPKEMLSIVDKPTLQYIVEETLASGIELRMACLAGRMNPLVSVARKSGRLRVELLFVRKR